jgi:hypothetical protein
MIKTKVNLITTITITLLVTSLLLTSMAFYTATVKATPVLFLYPGMLTTATFHVTQTSGGAWIPGIPVTINLSINGSILTVEAWANTSSPHWADAVTLSLDKVFMFQITGIVKPESEYTSSDHYFAFHAEPGWGGPGPNGTGYEEVEFVTYNTVRTGTLESLGVTYSAESGHVKYTIPITGSIDVDGDGMVRILSPMPFGYDFTPIAVKFVATTCLSVVPAKVESWTSAYGKTFNVNITLQGVTGLYGYEFKLYWNTTLLDLVGVHATPPASWGTHYFVGKNETNEALGRWWCAVALTPNATTFSGNATLATLTFKTTYDPIYPQNVTSLLHFADTYLSDANAQPISHLAIDGEYHLYSTKPKIQVKPLTHISKKVETFSMNVTVSDIVNLYKYEFKLSYNTTLLDALTLSVGPFLQPPYLIYKFSIDNVAGVVTLGVASSVPASPANGSGVLATITFKTIPIVWPDPPQNTTLHLYDTLLVTNLGVSVPHDTVDGLYGYKPIPGDVNSDGGVDVVDMRLVSRAWGTRPGDPYWDPRADLNRDGLISIFDLVLVSKNLGRTDP